MAKIRAITVDGDWTAGQGLSNYKSDEDALNQDLKTRLLEWVGDCFFNATAGIDWKTFLNPRGQPQIEQSVKALILQTQGVVQLSQLSSVLTNRSLVINYAIKTIYSPSVQAQIVDSVTIGVPNG